MRAVTTRLLMLLVVLMASPAWGGQLGGFSRQGRRTAPVEKPPQPVADARLDRLERWLLALDHHVPGVRDDAVREVGAWSNDALRLLWLDANVVVQLMRNPKLNRFVVRAEGEPGPTAIRFTPGQLRRLQAIGCAAAGGLLTDEPCLALDAGNALHAGLRELSARAFDARLRHDANYVLRRGALLHTDVVMFAPPRPPEPASNAAAAMPQRIKVEIADGQELGVRPSPVHWEIARMLLDKIQPPGMERPAPVKDDMVRQWYRATAAWMQFVEDHDSVHLGRAREIFPDDPDLVFLAACQREAFGAPAIQTAVRSIVMPFGFTMAVGNARHELQAAEELFRRAVELKPDFAEARLRLARVRGVLGRHEEAAKELRAWPAAGAELGLQYYAALFLGAEEEALGGLEAARVAYTRAAELFPTAQSPWLGLSELARRRGDRASALTALQRMFALSPIEAEREDPWWNYHVAQARNVDELLYAVRRPFLTGTPQ
jgi:tetratricopeptide (TPR) repeat protein